MSNSLLQYYKDADEVVLWEQVDWYSAFESGRPICTFLKSLTLCEIKKYFHNRIFVSILANQSFYSELLLT